MSIDVRELQPGDRVILNCPKGKGFSKRQAQLEGVFNTYDEATADEVSVVVYKQGATSAYVQRKTQWARFLLQTEPPGSARPLLMPSGAPLPIQPSGLLESRMLIVLAVEPDGGLRDETGLRVFIERRLRMGHG